MSTASQHAHAPAPRLGHSQVALRAALDEQQLVLHFLPVVDLTTSRAKGVEALLRWQHPEAGLVGPDRFLPGVAHTSLMHEVTSWVLRTAVAAVKAWPSWTVSVNVTANDVCRSELLEQVDDALQGAEVAPERLTLELTEQALVENVGNARSVMGALRDRGVGLSLDDFGTGYSSLLYLRDLPITELKIDRTFVSGGAGNPDDYAIVLSLAALGHSVGVTVVAEGVETQEHAVRARDAGCTGAQGFLWGRPAPAERIDAEQVQLAAAQALGSGPTPSPPAPRMRRTRESARIQELLDAGASLHTIAAALNGEGLRTPHDSRWTARAVAAVIAGEVPRTRKRRG